MFLFVASALAAPMIGIGWPCQRLNWAWRNVWFTCGINSYTPANAGPSTPAQLPFGFAASVNTAMTYQLGTDGTYALPMATGPSTVCTGMTNTGTGITVAFRNRCRRAIDAYGMLLTLCAAPPSVVGNARAPANGVPAGIPLVLGDANPTASLIPHSKNVGALTTAMRVCMLPGAMSGSTYTAAPNHPYLPSPVSVCPGLLGWFTVVFNACGFTLHPALSTTAPANVPNQPAMTPNFIGGASGNYIAQTLLLGTVTPNTASPTAGVEGTLPISTGGLFCSPNVVGPNNWNPSGPMFRTSRCRKALDQFGRTASRCHYLSPGNPNQGGNADPLKAFAVGLVPNTTPFAAVAAGANNWAPACNG